jgi:hypothetical protein
MTAGDATRLAKAARPLVASHTEHPTEGGSDGSPRR